MFRSLACLLPAFSRYIEFAKDFLVCDFISQRKPTIVRSSCRNGAPATGAGTAKSALVVSLEIVQIKNLIHANPRHCARAAFDLVNAD
ncbi:hypothetical protein EVAR_42848_1 [Eumeta japonica]|uniref:Uncharacterized protein n=1 Tax=Eumeta variegata TaxID=151549 RepID=A0A4C1WJ33_EUMVA|nr:hypothetical protein EVAR_42848_1 [Eumeta japonica]